MARTQFSPEKPCWLVGVRASRSPNALAEGMAHAQGAGIDPARAGLPPAGLVATLHCCDLTTAGRLARGLLATFDAEIVLERLSECRHELLRPAGEGFEVPRTIGGRNA